MIATKFVRCLRNVAKRCQCCKILPSYVLWEVAGSCQEALRGVDGDPEGQAADQPASRLQPAGNVRRRSQRRGHTRLKNMVNK